MGKIIEKYPNGIPQTEVIEEEILVTNIDEDEIPF